MDQQSPQTLRIAIAQLNPTVGDIAGNLELARRARARAASEGADLVLFSELFISGYPPEDLVLKPAFLKACLTAVEALAADTGDGGPGIAIGFPRQGTDGRHNSLAVLDGGAIVAVCDKQDLPNYGEFDEKRVFVPGAAPEPVSFRGVTLGFPICEDIWGTLGVCARLAEKGAELLLVPNGSPYHRGKLPVRRDIVARRVAETGLPLVYLNQFGGQDELVFDGASFALNGDGGLALQLPQFASAIVVGEWCRQADGWHCASAGGQDAALARLPDEAEADYLAAMIGLRDYVDKNGFKSVVLGLSGGLDSAICAAIAVDALGAERVGTVMLPYRYTSDESLRDAIECAEALGCRHDNVPIGAPVDAFIEALSGLFDGEGGGVTEENLQSRVRGTLLMAISNKFGPMVVTTGNKSEMAVGYATLYGDMNGGFNPIKDLYKTEVYALAAWRNGHVPAGGLGPADEVIPRNIVTKAPSAELRPDQTDQDSLPPYPVLDTILHGLIEEELSVSEIVAQGFERETVERVERLVYLAEYKRRQSAPGVKISRRNFGRDRRYPITSRFRDRLA